MYIQKSPYDVACSYSLNQCIINVLSKMAKTDILMQIFW